MFKTWKEKRSYNGEEKVEQVLMGLGNLTGDLEVRFVETKNGQTAVIGGFGQSIAFNFYNREKKEEDAVFYSVVAWGKTAENLIKFGNKGTQLCVFGRVQERKYTNQVGEEKTIIELVVEDFKVTSNGYQKGQTTSNPSIDLDDVNTIDDIDVDDIPF